MPKTGTNTWKFIWKLLPGCLLNSRLGPDAHSSCLTRWCNNPWPINCEPQIMVVNINSQGIKEPQQLVQFSSVVQSCSTLCDLVECSTPGFRVHHQIPELVQFFLWKYKFKCVWSSSFCGGNKIKIEPPRVLKMNNVSQKAIHNTT